MCTVLKHLISNTELEGNMVFLRNRHPDLSVLVFVNGLCLEQNGQVHYDLHFELVVKGTQQQVHLAHSRAFRVSPLKVEVYHFWLTIEGTHIIY